MIAQAEYSLQRDLCISHYKDTKEQNRKPKQPNMCRSHLMRWTEASAWNCAVFDKGCHCPFHITTQYGSDSHVILESQRWARKSALKGKDEREKLSLDGPLQAKMKNLRSPGSHKQQDWKVYRKWGWGTQRMDWIANKEAPSTPT